MAVLYVSLNIYQEGDTSIYTHEEHVSLVACCLRIHSNMRTKCSSTASLFPARERHKITMSFNVNLGTPLDTTAKVSGGPEYQRKA